jgi:hypothetical protein
MSVVVSVVNYLCSSGLKQRTFQAFLEEVVAECSDLLYHTEVMWLNRGRVLQLFVASKEEVSKFLEQEPRQFPELEDESWNHELLLLCYNTSK